MKKLAVLYAIIFFLLFAAWQCLQATTIPTTGAGPASSGFTPASLVGTQGGFWTAAKGITGGASVTGWADQSSLGNNLTSTGSSPAFSATGFNTSFPGITFTDASSNELVNSTFSFTSTTMSAWVLLSLAPTANVNEGIVGLFANGAGSDSATPSVLTPFFSSGANVQDYSSGDICNSGIPFTLTNSIPQMLGFIANGANGNCYLNNVVQGAAVAFSATLGNNPNVFSIGATSGRLSAPFTVAYVLVTNNTLSAGNMTALKTWTNANWGTSF